MAGLAFQDPRRTADAQSATGLMRGLAGDALPRRLDRAGALLLAVGDMSVADSSEVQLVADLDLLNQDAICALTDTASTAEAICRLYERAGLAFPAHLQGAASIALWLPRTRSLVLAADRFGFRRLYYAVNEAGIAFSSRVAGPLALPGVSRSIEADAMYLYLNFNTVPAPHTPYAAVRRLPPGHVLRWTSGRVTVEPYWTMAYGERPRPEREAAREMMAHTTDAVRRAVSGTDSKRTGAFLSGGTDSSTVLGLMSRMSDERVHAFSIGFHEERYNELAYAELAARRFDAVHYTHLVSADEAFASVPDLVRGYDEPFGNDSSIPTFLCARLAREAGMELLLAGDGGDEIFGGNERYRREQILARYSSIPAPLRRFAIEPLLRRLPAGGLTPLGKAQRYVQRASTPNPDRFYSSEFYVARERSRLLHPDFVGQIRGSLPLDIARSHYRDATATAELDRLLYVDLKITLGDNDLFKVTRTAELAGLGVRFPLLDPALVEFTGTLPARDKVRGTEKRYLFKRTFAGLLPTEILAKTKHGFGLPVSGWLKTHGVFRDLARDTLLSPRCLDRGYFAPGALERLFRLHQEDHTPYYGGLLWTILMLELWHREHGDVR